MFIRELILSITLILVFIIPVILEACARIKNPTPKMNDGTNEEKTIFARSRRTRNLFEV